ncbi:MAG: Bug family tripartite tricarboxylate transporter substrate binding protein [Burkholderiaceae bacterium]
MKILPKISALIASLLTATSLYASDAYPNQPIKIVIPYQPGSSPDSTMRFVGQQLSESLKQPVIIENKPGAGGVIGADAVAKAKPDGYTLGYLSNQHLVHPYVIKELPYDPIRDFRAVSQITKSAQYLLVSPEVKVTNVADFVKLAKSRKEPVTYGSGGISSPAHLAAEIFAKQAGFPALHVPYKGSPESINALIGGQVDYIVTTAATAVPLLKSRKDIRALAVTSNKRSPVFPDVPTLAESMPNGLVYEPWGMIMAPASTPQPIVDKLNKAFTQILKDKRTVEYFDTFGSTITIHTPSEADAFYKTEATRLASWIKDLNIKFD